MSERTAEATTTVDEDGIRVEKSFTDDAFPVPAVMYELSSTREDPVRVRIVDRIPESFPMDRIGFHPEYESENWTAYKDHRVEFERVVDPGDEIETVFGIRDDDPDLEGFLGTPVIEHVPVGEEIEDVLGAGDTDAVREVLSGDRATLPGMEQPLTAEGENSEPAAVDDEPTAEPEVIDDPPEAAEADEESEDTESPEPREVVAGTAAVTSHTEGPDADEPDAGEPAVDEPKDATIEADEEGESDESAEPEEVDPDATGESREPMDAAPATAPDEGLAAALAAEIRAGGVDDADLETLRSELDVGVPRSVDVRIARLQSSVADIEAYADALAEFIDGEGTAREILDDLDEKVDAVESEMAAIDDRVISADADRNDLREEVSRVDESVSAATDEIDAVSERVDGVDSQIEGVDDRVEGVETDVSNVEESVTNLDGTVADLGDTVVSVEETVDGSPTMCLDSTTRRPASTRRSTTWATTSRRCTRRSTTPPRGWRQPRIGWTTWRPGSDGSTRNSTTSGTTLRRSTPA